MGGIMSKAVEVHFSELPVMFLKNEINRVPVQWDLN